jgi:4-hydroxy-tetrahydrodipicolinate synthase
MINWSGVFPAVTTQFNDDESINYDGTQTVVDNLIKDGIHGIIALGTVGENNSLMPDEKRSVIKAIHEATAGRVPVLSGVAETTTRAATKYVNDAAQVGLDGVMLLPAMVYQATDREVLTHFQTVARNSDLPIMVYNNPVSYGIDITVDMFGALAEDSNIVAIKESSTDTRRLVDLRNAYGDRFTLFAGVDDIALECLMLGATGWVSGLTNAFPRESVMLYELATAGRYKEANEIYRWFMDLLHLDTRGTLVQCIKLTEQLMGRGSEMVRAPRLVLEGAERAEVEAIVTTALKNRPDLDKYR